MHRSLGISFIVISHDTAEALIAGCTELPLVLEDSDVQLELIDPGDLLARRCVAVAFWVDVHWP